MNDPEQTQHRTLPSAVDAGLRFTKSVEGVMVTHMQLMEELGLKSNLLMKNLMWLINLSILVTVLSSWVI